MNKLELPPIPGKVTKAAEEYDQNRRGRTQTAASLGVGLTAAALGLTGCAVKEQTPVIPPSPISPTAEGPTPTLRPTLTPEPTPTPEPAPTPTAVIEMGLSEMAVGGEETDILKVFDQIVRVEVDKQVFEKENPGLKLLVPEGANGQAFVQFQKDGQTWVLGNLNLPVFQEGRVNYQPVFNSPQFVWLMGWVDNEGNWLYHIPLQPGVEGQASIVYQKDNQLYEGLVDLETGKIDPQSEKPYWQEMPWEAVKAVMAKYGNAVYVTFWDRNGKQLEAERIKVCDLPPEPTPTPEPTKTPEVKFIELRNCTTNAPEALEKGVRWAIETAAGEQGKNLSVNGGREVFKLTKNTKVIIEVVPPGSPRAYLLFSNVNQFGYYKERDRLLIVVEGGPTQALFRALLAFQLDPAYLLANPDNPEGSQIPMGAWDTTNYQPLADLWIKAGIDNVLTSPDAWKP